MPAKGTTTGNKQNWLRIIALGLNILGQDATNEALIYWLRAADSRDSWRRFADELPNLGTLKNYFTEVRKTASGLDRPWSIGQTVTGEVGEVIPAEALPLVLRIWQRTLVGGRTLTVRQALWCARLINIHYLLVPNDSFEKDYWIQHVYGISALYAAREQLAEQDQDPFGPDTGDLDAAVSFGMANLTGAGEEPNTDPARQLAADIGVIRDLGSGFSDSTQIDEEQVRKYRELIGKHIFGDQSDFTPIERSNLNGYWPSMYVSLGLRSLMKSDDWNSISEEERGYRALSVGTAVVKSNWEEFNTISRWNSSEWDASNGGDNV